MPQKAEVPNLHEPVQNIRYIGPYLQARMNAHNIFTVADLVNHLATMGGAHENPRVVKERVKAWLENHLLENARPLECVYPSSRVINGVEYSYRARAVNFKAFNAVLNVWRGHIQRPNPILNWIPRRLAGFQEHNKYHRRCNMDLVQF